MMKKRTLMTLTAMTPSFKTWATPLATGAFIIIGSNRCVDFFPY
jgi:hypothetical protein